MDIFGFRIVVFVYGDYCDKNLLYVIEYIDFLIDLKELCNWVKNVEFMGGGDSDECYELVLYEV